MAGAAEASELWVPALCTACRDGHSATVERLLGSSSWPPSVTLDTPCLLVVADVTR